MKSSPVLTAFALFSAVFASPTSQLLSRSLTASNQVIHPAVGLNNCLTAASNSDGAAVEIEDCTPGETRQSWNFTGTTVTIFGNMCLDDTNGNRANGQTLQIFECFEGNTNQMWSVIEPIIQLTGTSKCMDNTNGELNDGNPAQIWDCTGGTNQKWLIEDAPPVSEVVSIQPLKGNGECLTASKNADSAAVEVEPCNGSDSQTWTIIDGTIAIFGDKCLDVTNGSTANGVKMQIFTCFAGNTNQQYTFTPVADSTSTTIHWANHDECLDLTNGDITPGNQVQVWECVNGNTNQIWNIVPA